MKTKIEWTNCTWNFITGCTQISPACDNCYAKAMTKRLQGIARKKLEKETSFKCKECGFSFEDHIAVDECIEDNNEIYCAGKYGSLNSHKPFNLPKYYQGWDKVIFHEDALKDILDKKKYPSGSKVFVNSMSDTFHENISLNDILNIFYYTSQRQDLTFQFLTKRPKNMIKMFDEIFIRLNELGYEDMQNYFKNELYKHCWFGVTAENQEMADERIPELLNLRQLFGEQSKNLILFVSVEPMLEKIDLRKYITDLDWVIVGGENAPKSKTRPMNVVWARDLYEQCKKYNIPFFFKQWGNYYELNSSSIANIKEFPKIDELK